MEATRKEKHAAYLRQKAEKENRVVTPEGTLKARKKAYKDDFENAQKLLLFMPGKLKWSTHDYQLFTFTNPLVYLIFYPHTNSNFNTSVRVRNQHSKNNGMAYTLLRYLDSNGFTAKVDALIHLGASAAQEQQAEAVQ